MRRVIQGRVFAVVIKRWQKIKDISYLDFHFLEKREGHDGMLKFKGEEVIKTLMTYQQCTDHNIKTLQLVQSIRKEVLYIQTKWLGIFNVHYT